MKTTIIYFIFALVSVSLFSSTVENPDKPLKGDWDFKLKKAWSVSKAGEQVFANPRQILTLEDGTLYVYDSKNQKYYIFGKDGKFIKAFGERGEGPGEIKNLDRAQFFLVNDKMIVLDIDKLHYFTKDGKYIKSETNLLVSRRPNCFLNEDEFITAPVVPAFLGTEKGEIKKINLKTKAETVIADYSMFRGGVANRGQERVTIVLMGITPMMILNAHQDKIYCGMNESYTINVFDTNGKKTLTFSLKRDRKKVTEQAKRNRLRGLARRQPADVVENIIKSLPDVHTHFYRIEIYNGLIYVFLPDLENPDHQMLDIFSPEGKYLYRSEIKFDEDVSFMNSPFNNLIIKKDHLYIVLESEDGDVMVSKYKITLPGL